MSPQRSGRELQSKETSSFAILIFRYNGTPVLHDINLRIPAGSSLAIVGPTGSGKTTLVSLIARIYDAAPGTVLIDGRPVRDYPLEVLRRNIGFVPQETFLFSETVRENIAFGVEMPRTTRSAGQQTQRASPKTLRAFPSNTGLLLESAALRFPAGRSSAPRLPAP